jgi:hypothetical protein
MKSDDAMSKKPPLAQLCSWKHRDNSVGTATDYGLDDRLIGVRIPAGAGNFSL